MIYKFINYLHLTCENLCKWVKVKYYKFHIKNNVIYLHKMIKKNNILHNYILIKVNNQKKKIYYILHYYV